MGGEACEGFDAGERLFFPVSGGKVNTGFGVGIFIPQLFRSSVISCFVTFDKPASQFRVEKRIRDHGIRPRHITPGNAGHKKRGKQGDGGFNY